MCLQGVLKTMKIELACQCPKCGNWNAVTTNNLKKACFICKICGNSKRVRGVNGWNVRVGDRMINESLSETIMRLNKDDFLR